jgi:hypothetical protein
MGHLDIALPITMPMLNHCVGPRSIFLSMMTNFTMVVREKSASEAIAGAAALLSPIRTIGDSALATVAIYQMQRARPGHCLLVRALSIGQISIAVTSEEAVGAIGPRRAIRTPPRGPIRGRASVQAPTAGQ